MSIIVSNKYDRNSVYDVDNSLIPCQSSSLTSTTGPQYTMLIVWILYSRSQNSLYLSIAAQHCKIEKPRGILQNFPRESLVSYARLLSHCIFSVAVNGATKFAQPDLLLTPAGPSSYQKFDNSFCVERADCPTDGSSICPE